MIFDFFKVLFTGKQKEPVEVQPEPIEPVDTGTLEATLQDIPMQPPVVVPKKPPVKNKKAAIMDTTPKEPTMAEIFFVVIDTTGRVEAKAFKPGLQNVYFIFANDEENAKQIVLSTFRRRPDLMSQLQFSIKATRLSAIVKTVRPGANFWTYIPFGGQRQPGQQSVPPDPSKLLRQDEYGQASSQAYIPEAPIGGEEITPDDLRGVQFSGADGRVLNKIRGSAAPLPEEAPPMTPYQESTAVKQLSDTNNALLQQNAQMMAQMQTMMAAIAAQNAPKTKRGKAAPATAPAAVVDGPDIPVSEG